ncbi:MAG TPA: FkbM family methyltransferase [Sulfuricurvum sp.]|nr:FkbM family methyltransferase [Sulfuricurvum sp.]
MEKELLLYKYLSNRLPHIPRVTGLVNRIFKKIYFRNKERKNQRHIVDVYNFQMELDPFECVDGALFFYPHIYEKEEFDFLKNILNPNDIFLDIGANIGIYSLIASPLLCGSGKVISIEADPYNYQKLLKNIQLNHLNNIIPLNIGVSDKTETLNLGINETGNRGGNSFCFASDKTVHVNCKSLIDIISDFKLDSIKMIKIDIEGFEYKVLHHFINNANKKLYPDYILIEHLHMSAEENSISLLLTNGYTIIKSNKSNTFLQRSTPSK